MRREDSPLLLRYNNGANKSSFIFFVRALDEMILKGVVHFMECLKHAELHLTHACQRIVPVTIVIHHLDLYLRRPH